MKKKIAKVLRHKAEDETIGQGSFYTRRLYRKFKKEWKEFIESKLKPVPKFITSKRSQRIKSELKKKVV